MIDKIGAGHYQTRDGNPVVILCLDAPGKCPVVGYTFCSDRDAVLFREVMEGEEDNEKGI